MKPEQNPSAKPEEGGRVARNWVIPMVIVLIVVVAAVAVITRFPFGPGHGAPPSRPWIDNIYAQAPDSALLQQALHSDTLAALTMAWRYLQKGDTLEAATLLYGFNKTFDPAATDLNYLTGIAVLGARGDSLAMTYLESLRDNSNYPEAEDLLARAFKNLKRYEDAIKIYEAQKKRGVKSAVDSILRCRADMGDTISGIAFARRLMAIDNAALAASYYGRFVSKARGVAPAQWNYEAGKAYLEGHNFQYASVYLANADEDTDFMELSFLAGEAYFLQEVYDSSASKLKRALQLGDSTSDNIYYLFQSLANIGQSEEAARIAQMGITRYPREERFYYLPAKRFWDAREYEQLRRLAGDGLEHIGRSFKLETYLIAAQYALGDTAAAAQGIDELIDEFRFHPGTLPEAARFFRQTLNMEEVARRLETADLSVVYPDLQYLLYWYQTLKGRGMADTARLLLEKWLDGDTSQVRLKVVRELYQREFPQQAHSRPQ